MATDGKRLWTMVRRYGPMVVAASGQVTAYLKAHPEIAGPVRRRVETWSDAVLAAQRRRSPEGQIDATIELVTRLAADRQPVDPVQAEAWDGRADHLRQALDLALTRSGPARRDMLARVSAEADALAAEVFDSLVGPGADDGPAGDAVAGRTMPQVRSRTVPQLRGRPLRRPDRGRGGAEPR
ncbi:hypothetical protein [Cellulomonas shaoxiangyii]|uniref:Uncharacterized protein n=1 Tax=Cellulomonas shaoxiangyii TaxID=2566013 RepID=A0A4V1CMB5_9CELL|nr:hypothetical protein [Cellulomonas shaoxiangyii]QCB92365.1 hypothetical protein E5225_01135 [Cellulomonas shaoxiangyii]TGY86241.1 hypothetical protein E5226_02730 [Cellulomonas shaoxiangyii]